MGSGVVFEVVDWWSVLINRASCPKFLKALIMPPDKFFIGHDWHWLGR